MWFPLYRGILESPKDRLECSFRDNLSFLGPFNILYCTIKKAVLSLCVTINCHKIYVDGSTKG